MDGIDVALIVARAVSGFLVWLLSTALLIWGERRLVSFMQTRVGPNRLGPFGIFQVLADGAKMFFKEDITPKGIDKVVYVIAPLVSVTVAFMTLAVVPFGGTWQVNLGGELRTVPFQVWDPPVGLLWFLAMSSIGVYGIALGGWASGSKYPLLGGVRSTAQLISYELSMGLSMAAVFIFTGTLRASEIVAAQSGTFLPFVPAYNIIPMSPAFVIFFLAVVAEAQRPPFDLAEAEGELVAGFHTEYSGAKFAMFMLGEFMAVITMSTVVVTLFLGGPTPLIPSPFGDAPGFASYLTALWGLGAFAVKVFVFVFVFIWLRGTLPRLRYDRLMDLGWKVMLPLSLVWVLASGFSVVFQDQADRSTVLYTLAIALGAALVIYLIASLPVFGPRPVGGGGGPDGGGRGPAGLGGPTGGAALTPGDETVDVETGAGSYIDRPLGSDALDPEAEPAPEREPEREPVGSASGTAGGATRAGRPRQEAR